MTDRYFAITVLLEGDIREDDAQPIIDAIRMIKGVIKVKPHISNPDLWGAVELAKSELRKKIWDIVK